MSEKPQRPRVAPERAPERVVVIQPDMGAGRGLAPVSRLEEGRGLALALDLVVADGALVRVRKLNPATLFGRGNVEAIKDLCKAAEASICVINASLTPVQQRNLETALEVKVVDRTGLILEIFGKRAATREGKLQVELARLDYERSRLVRTWTHLERQRATGKTGGPGETQIELDRRLIGERIKALKAELEEVRRTRSLHRTARRKVPYPIVALVGYTNAGKSTLFNTLTRAEVLAQDLLFATLDTTLRTLKLPEGRSALLSDTVGFISDLPHELVAAFRATLEEVVEADLIIHVRDVANEDTESQKHDVEEVLRGIHPEFESTRRLEVWNKIDLLGDSDREIRLNMARREASHVVPVSAVTGEGIDALLRTIAAMVDADGELHDLTLSAHEGQKLAFLYAQGRVVDRIEDEAGRIHLQVRLTPQAYGRYVRLDEPRLRDDRS